MTQQEMVCAVRGIVDEYRAKPQRFLSGRVVLVVTRPGKRAPGGERMRVLPGVMGRFLCQNSDGGIVVDVAVADLERWLARAPERP